MKFKGKIAIIGCGYWGSIIAKNLRSITNQSILLFDINKNNLKNLNKLIRNTKTANSLKDIYFNENIKYVFLITPPSKNINIIKQLIKNKKNIFLEKPGLLKISHFNKIIKLNTKFKNTIMVGYIYLYNKYILKIKKILKKNELGNILFIKSIRENLGPIRNDVDCNYDLASHDLSIILYLTGKQIYLKNKIKYNILRKFNTDISILSMKYKKIFVDIRTSWLNPEKIRKLVIIGSKKMLVFNETSVGSKLYIYNHYARYPKISKLNKIIFSKIPKIYRGNYKMINIKNDNPLKQEIVHFFSSVKRKKQPTTNLLFAKEIVNILKKTNKN